jgi:predicted ATPase with chaperone activity
MPTPGILSVAIAAARAGLEGVVVPAANALEATQVDRLRVVPAETLAQVVGFTIERHCCRRRSGRHASPKDEVRAAVRAARFSSLEAAEAVVLETDGSLSVVRRGSEEEDPRSYRLRFL